MGTRYSHLSVCRMIPIRHAGLSLLFALAVSCLPAHVIGAPLSQPVIQQFFVPIPGTRSPDVVEYH